MASFASLHVCSASKTIVPWSVISLDPSQNFEELFRSVQAGKYAIVKTSTELAAAVLEPSGVSVGKDKSSLSLVDKDLNTVHDVCTVFGHYVKFTVTLNEPGVSSSLDHCCQIRHYSFCIKKCGSSECEICKPVRMDSERFKSIHFLPDPVMGSDDHYVPFTDVYGTDTSENECPSLIQRRKVKTLTYSPSEQHARIKCWSSSSV